MGPRKHCGENNLIMLSEFFFLKVVKMLDYVVKGQLEFFLDSLSLTTLTLSKMTNFRLLKTQRIADNSFEFDENGGQLSKFVWGFTLYQQYFSYLAATVHKSMFPAISWTIFNQYLTSQLS